VVDRDGFEAFYRARYGQLVRACALVVLDRGMAEDIAQESFARLWVAWERIGDDDHAGGYVHTTAMRLCWKRRRRHRADEFAILPAAEDEAPDVVARRRDLVTVLARLPFRQRQVIVLRDWAGFETAEVAEMTGITESTVRVHLARGRATLREVLRAEGVER
jgi:RNA polymerase sigma-70 factor (sigma-E family)